MPSRPGVFQFAIFLSVALSPCMSPGGLLRTFITLFPCCLSIRLFCYDLSVPIFCSKIFLALSHPVVDMASLILSLIVGWIFFVVLERPVLSCLDIFLAFLLSFVFFGWSPHVFFSSSCSAFPVSSVNFLMFPFSILAFCRGLFICVSSSNPNFDFLSRGPRFFQRLILLLRILSCLIPWCRFCVYLSISRSLSRFRTWPSSSLGSWEKAQWFSFQTWFF